MYPLRNDPGPNGFWEIVITRAGTIVGRYCRVFFINLGRTGVLVACLVGAPTTFGDSSSITAQAPYQIVAKGFQKPTGFVVHPQGDLFFSDRETGVLYRLTPGFTGSGKPAFSTSVVFAGLERPIGVAVEHDGSLLVVESDKGRLVRFAKLNRYFSAVPETVVDNLKDPRWLALDEAGNVLVSASGVRRKKGQQAAPDPKGDVVLRVVPDHTLTVVADQFENLQGVTFDHPTGSLFAAAQRRLGDKEKGTGTIFKILPDGSVVPVITTGFKYPVDLKVDVLGALFFTAKQVQEAGGEREGESHDRDEDDKPRNGVVLKATFKEGMLDQLKVFSAGLGKPEGLAFDRDGNLYVAEAKHGRVLRFQAPAPPVLDPPLPAFTRQRILTVRGTAEPNALITVTGGASPATGLAGGSSGAFAVDVSLTPETKQTLRVFATGSRGDGLTSRATEATVTQDDIPPDTQITGCPSGPLTTSTATFGFSLSDNLTPTGQLSYVLILDGAPLLASNSTVTLTNLARGVLHTLLVKAQDQAGNLTTAMCTFTVASAVPTITDFSTSSGPVGTVVTITGTNFDEAMPSNNIVKFNGTPAIVSSATQFTITTTVPINATTGPVTVANANGTATSPQSFTVVQCVTRPPGLVSWWPAEGNANDLIGTNNGALQNSAIAAGVGKVGQAFLLDGLNDFIQVPDNPSLDPGTGSFTIDAWVKTAKTTGSQMVVSKFECGEFCVSGANSLYFFFLSSGKLTAWLRDSDAGGPGIQQLTGTKFIADGQFHHIAMLRDMATSELRLYVDGQLDARALLNAASDGAIKDDDGQPDSFLIGASFVGGSTAKSDFFTGTIDEVDFFNRALTAIEIQGIFNADVDGKCKP